MIDEHTKDEQAINLDQEKFFFAFAVRNYGDYKLKDDLKHVKWEAEVIEGDGNS